jgi:hypothetical protein
MAGQSREQEKNIGDSTGTNVSIVTIITASVDDKISANE